jgi:hypothetical protein
VSSLSSSSRVSPLGSHLPHAAGQPHPHASDRSGRPAPYPRTSIPESRRARAPMLRFLQPTALPCSLRLTTLHRSLRPTALAGRAPAACLLRPTAPPTLLHRGRPVRAPRPRHVALPWLPAMDLCPNPVGSGLARHELCRGHAPPAFLLRLTAPPTLLHRATLSAHFHPAALLRHGRRRRICAPIRWALV